MKYVKIDHEGKQYIWDGQRWYGADDYMTAPTAIIQILNKRRLMHKEPLYPQTQIKQGIIFFDKKEDNSTILTDLCVICNKPAPHGQVLCDGRVYHSECYAELISRREGQSKELGEISVRVREHKRKIIQASSWIYKITAFFTGEKINVEDCEKAVGLFQEKEKELREGIEWIKQRIIELWDYWPEYPPDWDERSQSIRDEVGFCERCGEVGHLQVHHRRPVAKGGNHCPENLEVICVNCHGKIHGRDFINREYRETTSQSPYSNRIKILRRAIEEGLIIHFSYRKRDGERSTRSFKPQRFKSYGRSLCIEGWCYLRKDKRTFAVTRMSQVKIVSND
ncbi:MAG: WYL domain-containing protein [Erysipelotrichaceae bacterium]|nr:WYL domain-containing protein [Erysipelotrichaceae bacterium]